MRTHNKSKKKVQVFHKSWLILVLMCLLCCANHQALDAQEKGVENYRVKLKTRQFIPQEGIQSDLAKKIKRQIITGQNPHVMIQFKQLPSLHDRSLLAERGIILLNYIGNYAWYASVSDTSAVDFQMAAKLKEHPVLGIIRSIDGIDPRDKIAPQLAEKKIGDWARTEDGRINLVISYFHNTDAEKIMKELQTLNAGIVYEDKNSKSLIVTIKEEDLQKIAEYDFVKWIETVSPMGGPEAYRIRDHLQVNEVQTAPYNLTGNGVIVGVFDNSHAFINHPDLNTRAFIGDTDPTNYFYHPTNMAGLIAGNGNQTYQNRGMATQAQIYTYDYEPGTATGTIANNHANFLGDMQTAIGTHHIDIASNSWGLYGCHEAGFDYGDYVGLCPPLDAAVRGDYGKQVSIVFSAGNERDGYYDGTNTENTTCISNTSSPFANYFTMNHPKAAKNIIAVGAIDSYNNKMTQYSSWGPATDGRLKPEIVASGHHNGIPSNGITNVNAVSQMYLAPYYPTSGTNGAMYGYIYMTSAAAAEVSGCLALLLQEYRNRMATEINPLPSTLKALVIQSAKDLDDATTWYNPGPDYASGYGLLQIKDAVDLVESLSFREGKITSNSDFYTFSVPAGATEVKVSLVWDDPPALPNLNSALVNDLDLKVYDPANTQYFPWTLNPDNPASSAVRNAADHVNNVEQVFVNSSITPGTWRIVVEPFVLPEPPQRYSLVANYQLDGQIDIIQVLDRSGSMGELAASGGIDKKIEKLRDASSQFVNIMNPNIGNRLGLVIFNQNVVPFAVEDQAMLNILDGPRASYLINNTITPAKITHGGTTSIGDGLRQALNDFLSASPEPQHDRSILLVTDGKENTAEMIASVQPDLIANDITVYVLGLGFGSGIDETKLVNLVNATNGTYRITSDNLVFQKLFIETLAGAVNWSVISDPIGSISRGMVQLIPVVVQSDEVGVTFTVYWEGPDNAIDCELITPSGNTIVKNTRNSAIRYGEHGSYIYYHLDFPLMGELADDWSGEWKMKLTGTNQIEQNIRVRYSTSSFAESGPELEVKFNKLINLTGDEIKLEAKLSRADIPITGATIQVFGDVPKVGPGNVLHDGKVNWDQLHQTVIVGGDTLNLIERKLRLLSIAAKSDVLSRDSASIQLYDDGLHGDGAAKDGVYANNFSATKTQGSYTFRFLASHIPAGGGKTSTREWTKSFFNEVKIDPEYSIINLDKTVSKPSVIAYNLDVSMKDQYGNFMGPGHDVRAKTSSEVSNIGTKLEDQIDGSYSGEISLSKKEFMSGKPIGIYVDGVEFVKVPTLRKWSFSLHGGTSVPLGNFANVYKAGVNIVGDIGYHFTNQFAIIGLFGYNDFKSNATGVLDNYLVNILLNLRYYLLLSSHWSVYAGGGPGYYIPETGDGEFGANLGLGINREVSSLLNLELGSDYHFGFGNDMNFSQSHIGIILRF